MVKTLTEAIAYCQANSVVHRDLKVRQRGSTPPRCHIPALWMPLFAVAAAGDVSVTRPVRLFVCLNHPQPENILLSDPSDDALIKIADFGFANVDRNNGHTLSTACGTPG